MKISNLNKEDFGKSCAHIYLQHLYKKVTALKSTEDGIKKSYATNKDRIDKVKKGMCCSLLRYTLHVCPIKKI